MNTLIRTPPAPDEFAPFFGKYVALVGEGDIVQTLSDQLSASVAPLRDLSEDTASFRYGPSKWSIREVVGHVVDTERIMAYRALRIARGDSTPLPGFDEDLFVWGANFDHRTLTDLLEELEAVRRASVLFFASLDGSSWARRGTSDEHPVSAKAIAYIIAGHELHHRRILQERYLSVGK
jgi:hypothetical protein